MFTSKIRHWAVALGMVAVAGITAASAAGLVRHTAAPAARIETLPVPSGDLGEVVVYAPHDLGEVIVHAPHDLGEVLVNVRREPVAGSYFAHVIVTVPRKSMPVDTLTTGAAATFAAAR
jgi:hypothetical protein